MAADLTLAVGATLEVCVPICLPPLSASGGVDFAVELYDELERGAREDATAASIEIRTRFPELAGRLDVHTPEARMPDIPRLAGALGQSCDLVIAGQPIAEDATRADDALLDGALFHSGRPCLMLPRWNDARPFGGRIMIAWKDVPEAARAVSDAMPLLRRANEVCVVIIGRGSHMKRSLERSTDRLLRHLVRFSVKAEARAVLSDEPEGLTILDQAARWPADLLVMGGYGHSPLRERIFGGATLTAIRRSPIPVLLSH
jgi:nucleotide-binding universal stress UspA family protein